MTNTVFDTCRQGSKRIIIALRNKQGVVSKASFSLFCHCYCTIDGAIYLDINTMSDPCNNSAKMGRTIGYSI